MSTYPGGPASPVGGGRRRAVITMVVVIGSSLVLSGAALVAAQLTEPGSGDDPNANPTTSVTSTPTTAPTTDGPSPSQTATKDELTPLTTAIEGAGYACYESLTEPVLVHSCYLEPGTKSLDDQDIHIQVAPDGAIAALDVDISYFEQTQPPLQLFEKTVRALEGTLLKPGEAAAIINGRTKDEVEGPGTHNKQTLAWGTSQLFVSKDKNAYKLELVANGARNTPIPHGQTARTFTEIRKHYEGLEHTCKVDRQLQSMKCQRGDASMVFTTLAVDPCLGRGEDYELICKDAKAYSISTSVGFANNLTNAQYEKIVKYLIDGTNFNLGGMESEAQAWLLKCLNDSAAKPHRADFQGMHISVEPGAGVYEEFPNVYQVQVVGHNLTS